MSHDPGEWTSEQSGTVTAAIVCYDSDSEELRLAIDSLRSQSRPPRQILLLDNGPGAERAAELDGYAPTLRTIDCGSNLGYGGAINLAARESDSDYLLCMNPDAHAHEDCVEQLLRVADADRQVALVGAQILLADGSCNAGDNPLHPTGISTSGHYGEPREQAPPREVAVVSGACCLIRRASLLSLGGFFERLFLYYEDVDISWRARIAGMRVVYCPAASVSHGYEFGRRERKWFLLERNRLLCLLSNYEAKTLMLLAPLLALTELGLLAVAARGGWLRQKLAGYRSLLAMAATLPARRCAVAATRRHSDAQLLGLFDDRLDSALLPGAGSALANAVCVPYLRFVRSLLRAPAAARESG
ncbi:MAG TPA: glycosyltransferase family 2 protein [Solirubrobacteraceae bacterium]|nr:glycosyltransferase family 2 protein [Solirubrobacteraceae bacterium]